MSVCYMLIIESILTRKLQILTGELQTLTGELLILTRNCNCKEDLIISECYANLINFKQKIANFNWGIANFNLGIARPNKQNFFFFNKILNEIQCVKNLRLFP